MKKSVIFLICLMTTIAVFGQKETKHVNVEEVQVTPPKFSGVHNAQELFNKGNLSPIENYLAKNFVCPYAAAECRTEGTEIIRFTVNPNGYLSNFEIINSVCREIDSKLIELLVRTNGMWMPGYNNGEPTAMEQEVSFMVGDYNHDEMIDHFVEEAEKSFAKASTTLLENHKPRKALRFYNTGIRYLPNDKGLLLMRGLCHYELGHEKEARRDWDRIVSLGGGAHGFNMDDLAQMKGYPEMTRILAQKDKN